MVDSFKKYSLDCKSLEILIRLCCLIFIQSVSVRACVRASHACVRKSRCEGGAKLHGIVRANVRACMVFWVHHTRAITLEIFQ